MQRTLPLVQLLETAIVGHKQVVGACQGQWREFCPHLLGTRDGRWRTLVWQFAGGSQHGLPPEGDWRCFDISDMANLELRDGPWHRGWVTGRGEQRCVGVVQVAVDQEHAAQIRHTSPLRTPQRASWR